MSPWLAFGKVNTVKELFVYKSDVGNVHNSDRYPAVREKTLMLIERFPPTRKPLKNKVLSTEMLALFLGLLENWEVRKLVDILKKFGICENDAEGLEQIKLLSPNIQMSCLKGKAMNESHLL